MLIISYLFAVNGINCIHKTELGIIALLNTLHCNVPQKRNSHFIFLSFYEGFIPVANTDHVKFSFARRLYLLQRHISTVRKFTKRGATIANAVSEFPPLSLNDIQLYSSSVRPYFWIFDMWTQ